MPISLRYTFSMRQPITLFLFVLCTSVAAAQDVPVDLPVGFSIQKVAGNDLVPDASAMTVDPKGAPIVSGPGYVRKLIDKDGDGIFDDFELLAKTTGIAQGIWFDGKEMWLTVDGAIKRSVSRQHDQPFVFEDIVAITTDQEHGSHAVRKGEDGWWYVICGNATEIRDQFFALESSPVKDPRAGFLMRFRGNVGKGSDFKGEILCHGFRNAYDFDFDGDGGFFVYDSDGERDISLPWYRPTRIFQMKAGDDAGWVSASWKRPASFHDMPKLVGELGRGSPTGVTVCKTDKFGGYKNAVFVGDWTFGRVGVVRPGRPVEVFAKPAGTFGFAITDLEFSMDGSLFVTTGGRGTEGALFRIVCRRDKVKKTTPIEESAAPKRELTEKQKSQIEKARNDFNRMMRERAGLPAERDGLEKPTITVKILRAVSADRKQINKLVRDVQLEMGGCNGDRMFAGHVAKNPVTLSAGEKKLVVTVLQMLFKKQEGVFETARLIGMLKPNDDLLANAIADVATYERDPVRKIHYLNCLAVAGGKLDDKSVNNVASSLLAIRRDIDEAELPVDRNWEPRMRQLASMLFKDMRIPEAVVKDSSYGQPSDVWLFDVLPEIFKSLAKSRIAMEVKINREDVSRRQLRCLSADQKYVGLIRSFSDRDEFVDLLVLSVHSNPNQLDVDVLFKGLDSFSLTVNKASLIGLQKIARPDNFSKRLKKLLSLESSLGWSNPEISVRDQLVRLLESWCERKFQYQQRQYDPDSSTVKRQQKSIEKLKDYVQSSYNIRIDSAKLDSEKLIQRFLDLAEKSGDMARGEAAWKKFQCAACHNGGGQMSGPSLAGVTSRFSREDIVRAIVDPNENVPDRYRATLVATEDGQLFKGSIVYESMAGVMLATNTGEVVRIDAADIEAKRKTSKSLMPEGLLDRATDQEIADLWAYLKNLK